MINIPNLMGNLATKRKAYFSEADFQHSFAWEVHKQFPEAEVRLERPIKANGKLLHLDFQIQLPDKSLAVELKYKTRNLLIESQEESYSLSKHGALPQGKYDFIKDIVRLENITSSLEKCEGYAILLTNDNAYWRPRFKDTVDKAFNLTEGNILSGEMAWTEAASPGTKKNRENSLVLSGSYKLNWQDYSFANQENCGQFRYLAVHIQAK
jgi:hypothetical protein